VAVADTHSRPHVALGDRIAELGPHHIVHAGDIGDLSVLRALERHAPVTAVRGNIDVGCSRRPACGGSVDVRIPGLPDLVTIEVRDGDVSLLNVLLVHIAVNGPKLRADVARIAKSEDASLVVCGHSHVPFAAQDRGITVFNPGSVGPRRFELPIVLGLIEITPNGASVKHIDCETGRPWKP
jgi:putative phosphoesterase